MSTNTTLTWAQRASDGAKLKFYQPTKRRSAEAAASSYRLVGSVLYEDDDLKGQILASKAMAIVQQALTSGSVLFSFRKGIFGDRVDAYKAIQVQVSPLVEFRPLSVYDEKNDGSLLIEAKFEEVEDAHKALNTGVTVDGVVYKAVHAKECKEFGELKHVQFTLMRIVKEPTFLIDLMDSLAHYGRVLQVKQFTRGGFFEGKFSVMLDTSVGYQVEGGEQKEAQPLDRMLYLSEFDCFVAATYKGAPPICHFCRHSGHIRDKCPELLKRRCYGCQKQGHMLRFCPEQKDQSASYTKKQKVAQPVVGSEAVEKARQDTEQVMDVIAKAKVGAGKEDFGEEDEELGSLVDEDESLQGVESVDASENDKSTMDMEDLQEEDHQVKSTIVDEDIEDDEIVLAGAAKRLDTVRSSAYSKYASNDVAMNMSVDSPEEMLKLTKLKEVSQRKRVEFNSNLKAGTGAGLKAYSGGDSSESGAGNNGLKSVGSGSGSGVSGSGGVKNNKTDGKQPSKTKQNARRGQ
ncbi:CCHC-type zinc finger transcription factor [Mucor lusitanicus CBS 277.49]|uniref:CCHC-type zinc finger transcription factor n=1 Tax=Mucor lusitanicus CBS 277.49 TaxID=747725 RepID=A0A162QMC3_MUCCL|nr:CCHC-type zinc finger transcription factor [Mucor lusitanicus CBS 277.49]